MNVSNVFFRTSETQIAHLYRSHPFIFEFRLLLWFDVKSSICRKSCWHYWGYLVGIFSLKVTDFSVRVPIMYRHFISLKLEKIWFFCVKSWFFTRNTPKMFAPPSAIGKNMIFWRKIVIFHTKYPKNFAPPSARCNFFKCAPPPLPNLKSWIRPCLRP